MYNERKHIVKFLFPVMMILSLFLGVFTSYYFIFVNGLFIREVGASYLSYAFMLSGGVGYLITYLYNRLERKIGFFKSATYFNLLFVLSMSIVFYFYYQKINPRIVIFSAFTWIWISSNYVNLIFWKIPSIFFDLSEHKQYNGWISTGEVVSSIVAYSSVYIFKIDYIWLLTFSGMGMIGFFVLFIVIRFRLGGMLATQKKQETTSVSEQKIAASKIWKAKYFRYIFGAVFFAIIIQLIVDYSMLEVTAHDFKDQKELSSYLALWYTFTRVLEFLLKTLVSRYIIKELGLFVGLISIVSVLGIVVLGGLVSIFTSLTSSILIFATLNKLFERSIFRSIYVPTVNVLYQAYPSDIRSVSQNYADGYGKTIGQIIGGLLILVMAMVPSFDLKMQLVFILMFLILVCWFLVSKKLIDYYRIELNQLIIKMKSSTGIVKSKNAAEYNIAFSDLSIAANVKFSKMVGMSPIQLQSISNNEDYIRAFNSFQQSFLQRVSNQPMVKLDNDEIEVLKYVVHTAKSRSIVPGSMNFQLNLLLYKDCWDYTSEILKAWTFEEVERGLIFITDHYGSERLKDFRVSLMYVYMYQLYYEKLPDRKKEHELRALCHLDKKIFSSVISDADFNLNREIHHQAYIQVLQKAVSDLTYASACLDDLKDNFPLLNKLLEAEKLQATQDIVNVLRSVHDKDIFDRIIPMIFMGNRSDEVIAAEMLELVLSDEEKVWVLPVMREKTNSALNRKLEVDFPQAQLSLEVRLLSIIGKNSSRLSEFTRLIALQCWIERFPSDKVFTMMSAYGFSNESYFKFQAHSYIKENHPEKYNAFVGRTKYQIESENNKVPLVPILEKLLGGMTEIIPISIVDMFVRCKMEDPDFLGVNDEGNALLQKVYKGRLAELEKCKKLFLKVFSVGQDSALADAG